jgi:glycerol-3-phosphate acyltransferase PlsY
MIAGFVGLVIAYLCGSFPSAYLAGRFLKGVDLRTIGSGNLGATNVYRELGAIPAVVVLLLDGLKGALPAALLPDIMGTGFRSADATAWWGIAYGAAAIAGHMKPVFLMGKGGGKGVATAAGVFIALTPLAALIAIGAFGIVVAVTRFVSLGSIVGAIAMPVAQVLIGGVSPFFYASLPIAAFVVWAHRANIKRLMAGAEPRVGKPGSIAR